MGKHTIKERSSWKKLQFKTMHYLGTMWIAFLAYLVVDCGGGGGWVEVEEAIRGINGNGKNTIKMKF